MKKTCPINGESCPVHEFVHGEEAEELREGIEKIVDHLMSGDDMRKALIKLLDKVDACDSLAYVEVRVRKRGRR